MIRAFLFVGILALAACEEASQAVDDVARRSAKAAVAETIATQFPAVPKQAVTPFTDCVIDNASSREIIQFSRDAVVGISDTTVALVQTVLSRPATQQCIVRAGLSVFGA